MNVFNGCEDYLCSSRFNSNSFSSTFFFVFLFRIFVRPSKKFVQLKAKQNINTRINPNAVGMFGISRNNKKSIKQEIGIEAIDEKETKIGDENCKAKALSR